MPFKSAIARVMSLRAAVPQPPACLPARVETWPEAWRELFLERSGILQYDAGLSRDEADARAEQQVREFHRHQKGTRSKEGGEVLACPEK